MFSSNFSNRIALHSAQTYFKHSKLNCPLQNTYNPYVSTPPFNLRKLHTARTAATLDEKDQSATTPLLVEKAEPSKVSNFGLFPFSFLLFSFSLDKGDSSE